MESNEEEEEQTPPKPALFSKADETTRIHH